MTRRGPKLLSWVTVMGIMVTWMSSQLARQVQAEEVLEFDVAAQCNPHGAIVGPSTMQVSFSHVSLRSGTSSQSFLSVDGGVPTSALDVRWDYPQQRWLSALFVGPPITAQRYCDPGQDTAHLQIHYFRQQGFKIYMNTSPTLGQRELDAIGSTGTPGLTVQASDPYKTRYQAGPDSTTPYWLQFAIPVHGESQMTTTVRYQLQ